MTIGTPKVYLLQMDYQISLKMVQLQKQVWLSTILELYLFSQGLLLDVIST